MCQGNEPDVYAKEDVLIEKYKILYDFIKFQHTRYVDFTKAFLLSNSIIISVCGYLLKSDNIDRIFVVLLSIVGSGLMLIWISVIQRLMLDADLRWYQIREIERLLNDNDGLFIVGDRFYKSYKVESTTKRNFIPNASCFQRTKLRHSIGVFLPVCFILFYFMMFWESTQGIFDTKTVLLYYVLYTIIYYLLYRPRCD